MAEQQELKLDGANSGKKNKTNYYHRWSCSVF